MPDNLKRHWYLVFLVLAILALFWPTLLHPNHVLYPTFAPFSDVMVIHWPKTQLIIEHWQSGQGLPYWSPTTLSGMPLAPNQLAMLFYPLAWLFLLFPPAPIFNILNAFHFLLGGVGIYFLLNKAHNVSRSGAILGGLTFVLNSKWVAHAAAGHVSMVGTIGWMPWAVLGVMEILKAIDQKDAVQPRPPYLLGWSFLTAIALTMQIFTHSLIFIYTIYLLTAIVVWYVVRYLLENQAQSKSIFQLIWAVIRKTSLAFIIIPILATLLAAVQLLPLLEITDLSNRALSLEDAIKFALTPLQLAVGLLFPNSQAGHEHIIYLGLIPFLLIPFGLRAQKGWGWFYSGIFIFTILFALGSDTPLHPTFYHYVPGFKWVRTPARMLLMGMFAISILVAFGTEWLQQSRWHPSIKRRINFWIFIGGSLAVFLGLGLMFSFGIINRATIAFVTLIPVTLLIIWLRLKNKISTQVTTSFIGLLLCIDLLTFNYSLIRFIPLNEALAPGRPTAEYLAKQPGLFRVYSPSYSIPIQTASDLDLQLADGVEPLQLISYDQFIARAGGYENTGFSVTIPVFDGPVETALADSQIDLQLLALLNVEYIVSAFPITQKDLILETRINGTYIYRNEKVLPRAWLIKGNAEASRTAGNASLIDVGPSLENMSSDQLSASNQVTITHYSANRLEIEIDEVEQQGNWLVISENWYPGWHAVVNGETRAVKRLNGLLRGIYLEETGPVQVIMTYQPNSVLWGGWISSVTAGVLILTITWMGIARRFYDRRTSHH